MSEIRSGISKIFPSHLNNVEYMTLEEFLNIYINLICSYAHKTSQVHYVFILKIFQRRTDCCYYSNYYYYCEYRFYYYHYHYLYSRILELSSFELYTMFYKLSDREVLKISFYQLQQLHGLNVNLQGTLHCFVSFFFYFFLALLNYSKLF